MLCLTYYAVLYLQYCSLQYTDMSSIIIAQQYTFATFNVKIFFNTLFLQYISHSLHTYTLCKFITYSFATGPLDLNKIRNIFTFFIVLYYITIEYGESYMNNNALVLLFVAL